MAAKPTMLTEEGLRKLEEELEFLHNVKRKEIAEKIKVARSYGDLSENSEYDDAKNEQAIMEARITQIESILKTAVIIDESNRMNSLVKQLLTLSKLESGAPDLDLETFDLAQEAAGIAGSMKVMAEERGASVSFRAEGPADDAGRREQTSGPVLVKGDEFKIEEVVTNYMSNALNHLDYDKKIDVRIIRENGLVRVSVFNTGNPIPEGDIDKIWDKFYKVDKARTREYGGSGIGLSIVKAIMESHNQQCGVKNYEDGVQFWFTLEGK